MTGWQKFALGLLSLLASFALLWFVMACLTGCARPSQREIERGIRRIKDGNDQ